MRSGRYRRSFVTVADGREARPEMLTHARVVELVNVQPYSRKIQVGAKGFHSRRGVFDAAARRLNREFPRPHQGADDLRAPRHRLSPEAGARPAARPFGAAQRSLIRRLNSSPRHHRELNCNVLLHALWGPLLS